MHKCCSLVLCLIIKSRDELKRAEMEDFNVQLDGEWNDLVSSSLLRELYDKKLNKNAVLTVTSDLIKLNKYINRLGKFYENMKTSHSKDNYFQLAKAVLSEIGVYNKWSEKEVLRINVKNFLAHPN